MNIDDASCESQHGWLKLPRLHMIRPQKYFVCDVGSFKRFERGHLARCNRWPTLGLSLLLVAEMRTRDAPDGCLTTNTEVHKFSWVTDMFWLLDIFSFTLTGQLVMSRSRDSVHQTSTFFQRWQSKFVKIKACSLYKYLLLHLWK